MRLDFFLYIFLIIFIYLFRLGWVFVACRLSLVSVSGGYALLWCGGFSLQHVASAVGQAPGCAGICS